MSPPVPIVVLVALASVLLALGCGQTDEPVPVGDSFIALGRDFVGFTEWERFAVPGDAIPTGAAPGPAYVYARELPPPGLSRFPVGTMLVKTIEPADLTQWTIHAMVKRSPTFNAEGTVGWEFFELVLTADQAPVILWRGTGPPSGHGYGSVGDPSTIPLVCSDCHAGAWTNDGVLTAELRL
ncbi:MAG: hypothetical protein DRJ42_21415 [Deltaproteobacteria bacterium]|nr:MAG: hypothetical protein DRJ42_21415 [Deltaproteobacteria bacterium]